jgi:hypothetical protein
MLGNRLIGWIAKYQGDFFSCASIQSRPRIPLFKGNVPRLAHAAMNLAKRFFGIHFRVDTKQRTGVVLNKIASVPAFITGTVNPPIALMVKVRGSHCLPLPKDFCPVTRSMPITSHMTLKCSAMGETVFVTRAINSSSLN